MTGSLRALLALLALSACADPANTVTEPPRVLVGREEQRLQLSVTPSGSMQAAYGDFKTFVELWRDQGWGPMTVEAPALPDAARERLRADIASRALRQGADADAILASPGGAGSYGVWLRFDKAVALLPTCGPESVNYGHSLDHAATSFGCATRRNIGAMVANPADLVDPRLGGDVNATRGAVVIGNHRKGPSPAQSQATMSDSGTGASSLILGK